MANRIQLRRDIGANWASVNPVLAQGEVGIETDAVPIQIKVGDGVTAWNSLSYVATGNMDVVTSTLDDLVDGTTYKRIAAALAATINDETRLPTAEGTTVANDIGAQTGATTLAKLQTLISSIDNIPDGTSYKRVQAAKADAINAGTYSEDDLIDGTSYARLQKAKADAINAGTYSEDDIADGTTYKRVTAAQIAKLEGIEPLADVTDETNVLAALEPLGRLPTVAGKVAADDVGAASGANTGEKLISKITNAGYSLDAVADGTSYKRIQAAEADAINGGTFDAAKVTAYGIGGTVDKGAIDVNTLTTNGIYKINGGSHCPGGLGWGTLIVSAYTSTYLFQLYVPTGSSSVATDCLYMRRMENGAWVVPSGAEAGTGWYKIWGVGNDGNGGRPPIGKPARVYTTKDAGGYDDIGIASNCTYFIHAWNASSGGLALSFVGNNGSDYFINSFATSPNISISLSGSNIRIKNTNDKSCSIYYAITQLSAAS